MKSPRIILEGISLKKSSGINNSWNPWANTWTASIHAELSCNAELPSVRPTDSFCAAREEIEYFCYNRRDDSSTNLKLIWTISNCFHFDAFLSFYFILVIRLINFLWFFRILVITWGQIIIGGISTNFLVWILHQSWDRFKGNLLLGFQKIWHIFLQNSRFWLNLKTI